MRLAVELYSTRLGHLEGSANTFDFTPDPAAISHFGANSRVLSVSIPLSPRQNRSHAGRRRAFFTELLPEGNQLEYMRAAAGLRQDDTVAFLARYGRDVAGALQIWDEDDPAEPLVPAVSPVSASDIRRLLTEPQRYPLGNVPIRGKSSLAGMQPKIVLARSEDGWNQVHGGHPSTHLLKPQTTLYPTVVFDEEYGARLARAVGLNDFDTHMAEFDGMPALVIERFDRSTSTPGGRIHQEDFNQALGATGIKKYQRYGGVVSLQRIAGVLQVHGEAGDTERLAHMTILAVAVGNLDMHAKNIGLLHQPDGSARLAPAYDFVPLTHHSDSDGELALAIAGHYRHAAITRGDLVAEIESWGVRGAYTIVQETLERLREVVLKEAPLAGSYPGLHEDILRFIRNLLDGRMVGADRQP